MLCQHVVRYNCLNPVPVTCQAESVYSMLAHNRLFMVCMRACVCVCVRACVHVYVCVCACV